MPSDKHLDGDRLVGHRLKAERLLAGETRSELARTLLISDTTLDSYESGQSHVPPRQLVAASEALGIPMSFFSHDAGSVDVDCLDDTTEEMRWLALSRPATVLSQASFARAQPLFRVWRDARGALNCDIANALTAGNIAHRTFLLRQLPTGSQLVVEHCAWGVAFLLPCESLLMLGRELCDMPDRDYGARMIKAYAHTAWSECVHVQSVRALIRTSAGTTLRTRYDRVLLPWRFKSNDLFVMCVSLQRELPTVL